MIRLVTLGVQLTWRAGHTGRARVAFMATGSGVATFVLLTALALTGMADRQRDREAAIAPRPAATADASTPLRGEVLGDGWHKRKLSRIVLAATGPDAPVPPGLDRLPEPGEVALSPALIDLIEQEPLVAQRFPQRPVAIVADDGLIEPGQLLAYVGVTAQELSPTAGPIAGFGDPTVAGILDSGAARTISLLVLLTLVAPVVMFMVACARLSATARDQRLAALRLIGLTPMRAQFVNATETGLVGIAGNVLGLVAWLIWRRVDEAVEIGAFGWFSTDLRLSAAAALGALVGLVALAVAVGAFGSRSSIRRPLRTRRERSVRTVSAWRAVPLVAGVALLALSWATSGGTSAEFLSWIMPFGVGLLCTVSGLILVVPFFAVTIGKLLARSSRPAVLLAGNRLRHEPAVAGRVVATLAVALFAAGFAQVILTAVDRAYAGGEPGSRLGDEVVNLTAWGPPTSGETYRSISHLGLALPEWTLEGSGIDAIAASCAELRVVTATPLPGCLDGRVQSVRSAFGFPDDDQPTDIDAALRASGLPPVEGELAFDIFVPDGSYTPDVVVPPSLAPPTNTRFTVPFTRAGYDPQAAMAALANAVPTGFWSPLVTYIDRLDSARIYSGIVAVGTVAALAVGLAALAVATVDRALERRNALAHLAAIGTPASVVRTALALQTLPVSIVVLTTAGTSALVGGSSYLRWGDPTLPVPLGPVGTLTGVALVCALVATAAAVVGTVGRSRTHLVRNE